MVFIDVGDVTHSGRVLVVLILFRDAEKGLCSGVGGRYLIIQITEVEG